MIITIDGPAASGKSTIAHSLAQKLQFHYINSGFLFRALTYLLMHKAGYREHNFEHPISNDIDYYADSALLHYECVPGAKPVVLWQGEEITNFLKDSSIDLFVPLLARNEYARMMVVNLQRHIAAHYDTVVEGRDTGSYVFPYADFKFFITASPLVRAERWVKDQEKRGNFFTVPQALERLAYRDRSDQERTIGRLIIPENAILIDTTDLTLEQSVEKMVLAIRSKRA